jgi:hypothetical protein
MCKRCDEIDTQIARYRTLRDGVNDRDMVDHLSAFITHLESEKSTFHPAPEEQAASVGGLN